MASSDDILKQLTALLGKNGALTKGASMAASSFEAMNAQAENTTDEMDDYREAHEKGTKEINVYWKNIGLASSALAGMAKDILSSGEGLGMFKAAIPVVTGIMTDLSNAMGDAIIKVGDGIPILGGITGAAGALTKALGKAAAAVVGFAMEMALDSIEQVWTMFESTASAGLLVADGLNEMWRQTKAMGITTQEYTALITKTKDSLVLFGGTVAQGAKELGKVVNANKDNREELRLMGLSYAEQSEVTAEYMARLERSGRLKQMSDQAVAQETYEYMKNLRVVAAMTGKSAETLKAEQKSAMDNIAFRVKVQGMEADKQKELMAAMDLMGPAQQQAAKETVLAGGVISDFASIATGMNVPVENFINSIMNGSANAETAYAEYNQYLRDHAPELQASAASMMQVGMAEMFGVGSEVTAKLNEGLGAALDEVARAQGRTADTWDAAANSGKNASKAAEDIAATLDAQRKTQQLIIDQTVKNMPVITGLMESSAQAALDAFNLVIDKEGNLTEIAKALADSLGIQKNIGDYMKNGFLPVEMREWAGDKIDTFMAKFGMGPKAIMEEADSKFRSETRPEDKFKDEQITKETTANMTRDQLEYEINSNKAANDRQELVVLRTALDEIALQMRIGNGFASDSNRTMSEIRDNGT